MNIDNLSLQDLQQLLSCDNLSYEGSDLTFRKEVQRLTDKKILREHKPPIKKLPSGDYYTYINGVKRQSQDKKKLEKKILEHYKKEGFATLNSIYKEFISMRKLSKAETTWQKDIKNYERFIEKSPIAKKRLSDLTLNDGYTFFSYCQKIKPDMTKKYWLGIKGTLNQMIIFAIGEQYLRGNPLEYLDINNDLFIRPKRKKDTDTFFTDKEREKVYALAYEDALETRSCIPLMICLLFNLGLRNGEICALQWEDIIYKDEQVFLDIHKEMIACVNKHNKVQGNKIVEHCKSPAGERRLLLNKEAQNILRLVKKLNTENGISTDDEDFIFMKLDGKIPRLCYHRNIDARLRKYCDKAEMKTRKSTHDIRRTVATRLFHAGMPLKNIQYFMGHSNLQQTMAYIKVNNIDIDITKYVETLSDNSSHAN